MTTSWSETIVVAWIVYILVESPRGAALVFGALSALVFVGAFRLALRHLPCRDGGNDVAHGLFDHRGRRAARAPG